MSIRTYNPSVRVGNWNEDIQLEEVRRAKCTAQHTQKYVEYVRWVTPILARCSGTWLPELVRWKYYVHHCNVARP